MERKTTKYRHRVQLVWTEKPPGRDSEQVSDALKVTCAAISMINFRCVAPCCSSDKIQPLSHKFAKMDLQLHLEPKILTSYFNTC